MQVPDHIGQHRVMTISPAAVSTGILDDFINALSPGVAFLLSEQADWINGADIVIGGGMDAFALEAG